MTFVNGVEETFDVIYVAAQTIRSLILTRETEQMFGELVSSGLLSYLKKSST